MCSRRPRRGAPVFYLLPGIDGGDDLDPGGTITPCGKSWFGMTDIQGVFANKNVNVVSPLGGPCSWYTDWVNDGSKHYQTYMTKELPPLINAEYHRTGVGGIVDRLRALPVTCEIAVNLFGAAADSL